MRDVVRVARGAERLHTGVDQDGQPFEVTRFVMRADRNALDHRFVTEDA